MSPRRPHLRNRKTIKTPKRFEDEYILTSPLRQEIPEESEESSELEEEIYESPRQRKPPSKRTAYRGKVTEFNPNLPPAAFPTLDHPDYVHNGGTVAIDLQPNESEVQSQNLASHEINVTRDLANMTSTVADFTRRASQHVVQPSITVKKQPQGSKLSSLYGESTDNGPRNPIWASNMARIAQAAKMSNLDRIMLEMESSDEEDAADRGTKIAGTATIPEFPAWDDLTVAHKLDLADTIAELYPDFSQVTHQLRLTPSQKEELVGLLGQRQDRAAREQANERRLQKQTKDFLLQGEHLSQSTFHQMVEDNLYKDIDKNDHHQTNLKELKKARAYLRYCGFPRALADDSWNVPSITNVTTIAKSRPMPSKPKASLSNVPAQTPSSPSERPSLRRPALYTRSQQSSYQSDHRSESVLPKSQGGAPSQYRPTPAHALITQHSPAGTYISDLIFPLFYCNCVARICVWSKRTHLTPRLILQLQLLL